MSPQTGPFGSQTASCADLLWLCRIFNTVMGLPFFIVSDSLSRTVRTAFAIYQRLTELIVLVGVVGQFWAVPYISHDMNILCACLASGTHSLQVILKTALLRSMQRKYHQHISAIDRVLLQNCRLEQTLKLHTSVPTFYDFHHKEAKYARNILVLFFFMTVASTSSYFIPVDVESIIRWKDLTGQHTPIVFYFHFDFMYTPGFQIVNVFLTICFYLVNLKTIVLDSFILALIVLHTVQFRHLKVLLDAVIDLSDSAASASVSLSQGKKFMEMWLIQHQAQLSLTYQFIKIMSPFLVLEFAYIFIHTCVPAFVITSTSSWTPAQKFAVFFIMGAGLFELAFISRAGDFLTEAVMNTTTGLYRRQLFTTSKWHRVVYMMSAVRAKVPLKLKAATVFPLCCPTFLTILRLILSYYMTLNEVQRMKAVK